MPIFEHKHDDLGYVSAGISNQDSCTRHSPPYSNHRGERNQHLREFVSTVPASWRMSFVVNGHKKSSMDDR